MMQFNEKCELRDSKDNLWGVISPMVSDYVRELMNKQLQGQKLNKPYKWILNSEMETYLECVEIFNPDLDYLLGNKIHIQGYNRLILDDHLSLEEASSIMNQLCEFLLIKLNS